MDINENLTLFPLEKYTVEKSIHTEIIPFTISKRYINFLYKAFNTEENKYLNQSIKAIQVNYTSALGSYLQLLAVKARFPVRIKNKDLVFFSVHPNLDSGFYKVQSGRFSLLEIPKKMSKELIHYIDTYLITSMISFVDGYHLAGKSIMEGVEKFMDKYELWDTWDKHVLHRRYYRDKERGVAERLVLARKI